MRNVKVPWLLTILCLLTLSVISTTYAGTAVRPTAPERDPVPYDSLRPVLEHIYDTDQGIREKLSTAKGDELGKLIGQMLRIDSANQVQVKLILDRYGWLPQSKVGEKAADALFYVVQHAEVALLKRYLPDLKRLARSGEAKKTNAALMEDRLLMYEGKKQIYGTQATSQLRADKTGAIWPIQDTKRVNQLRKEAGFDLTVEENAKRLGLAYDPDEKLPKTSQ